MRVKFLAKTDPQQDPILWTSLFPNSITRIGDIEFTFDLEARDYDWLVIYQDLPPLRGEKHINRIEPLACPRAQTLLITTEPSSIRLDGPHFMQQFGHILTHKHPELIRHNGQIRQTPSLRWFYGRPMGTETHSKAKTCKDGYVTLDEMTARAVPVKTKTLSTVCSNKQMSHTVHAKRYEFTMALKKRLDGLNIYGRGINPIDNKAKAMDDYRYHLAIENHYESGHWTEKLTDCFLAFCLPFYFGDPDYAKIFPKNSVIPIDIFNLDAAEQIIRQSISQNLYQQRLPDIIKARNLVLYEHNLMVQIAHIVKRYSLPHYHHDNNQAAHIESQKDLRGYIYGRHIFRRKHPLKAVLDAAFSYKNRRHPAAQALQNNFES